MNGMRLAIIGVGLLGGSVALAARQRKIASHILGIGRYPATLGAAQTQGLLDDWTTSLADGVKDADIVVVCTPVNRIAADVQAILADVPKSAILTDVGSTKANVLDELLASGCDFAEQFVAAHPLAGSEKSGFAHAKAELFVDKPVLLTPLPTQSRELIQQVREFWQNLGAVVSEVDPVEHDQVLAQTSHVPHLVAAALAKTTPRQWLSYSAGGFRDTTRIAGGDPSLWVTILQANRSAILEALPNVITELQQIQQFLEADQAGPLRQWLAEAKQVRDALGS